MNKNPDSELPVTDSNPAEAAAPGATDADAPVKPRRRRTTKVEPSAAEGQAPADAAPAEVETAPPARRRRKLADDVAPQAVTASDAAPAGEPSPVGTASNEASPSEAFVAPSAPPPDAAPNAAPDAGSEEPGVAPKPASDGSKPQRSAPARPWPF